MIQCKDCEYFSRDESSGRIMLKCDPFSTIKEPECLAKMQLLRLDGLLQMYQGMMKWYQKMAPMQEKMMDFMQREIDDIDESDSWKIDEEEDEDEKEDDKDDYSF